LLCRGGVAPTQQEGDFRVSLAQEACGPPADMAGTTDE